MIITDIDPLFEEAEKIQSFLEITPSDNPNEIIERGNDLIVYMARTGKMLADAKHHLVKARKNETIVVIDQFILDNKLSAKVQNSLIDGLCAKEQMLVDWLNRLNASCTHQLDWCRTVVSKNKEEMRLSRGM